MAEGRRYTKLEIRKLISTWRENVFHCLMACREGLPLNKLIEEMLDSTGEKIPLKEMGYDSIEKFLYEQCSELLLLRELKKDIVTASNTRLFLFVRPEVITNAEHLELRNLVLGQQRQKPLTKGGKIMRPSFNQTVELALSALLTAALSDESTNRPGPSRRSERFRGPRNWRGHSGRGNQIPPLLPAAGRGNPQNRSASFSSNSRIAEKPKTMPCSSRDAGRGIAPALRPLVQPSKFKCLPIDAPNESSSDDWEAVDEFGPKNQTNCVNAGTPKNAGTSMTNNYASNSSSTDSADWPSVSSCTTSSTQNGRIHWTDKEKNSNPVDGTLAGSLQKIELEHRSPEAEKQTGTVGDSTAMASNINKTEKCAETKPIVTSSIRLQTAIGRGKRLLSKRRPCTSSLFEQQAKQMNGTAGTPGPIDQPGHSANGFHVTASSPKSSEKDKFLDCVSEKRVSNDSTTGQFEHTGHSRTTPILPGPSSLVSNQDTHFEVNSPTLHQNGEASRIGHVSSLHVASSQRHSGETERQECSEMVTAENSNVQNHQPINGVCHPSSSNENSAHSNGTQQGKLTLSTLQWLLAQSRPQTVDKKVPDRKTRKVN